MDVLTTPGDDPFTSYMDKYWPAPYHPDAVPDGARRVVLAPVQDRDSPAPFRKFRDGDRVHPSQVFDVPAGQFDRWIAAQDAWIDVGIEIEAMCAAGPGAATRQAEA